MIPFGMEIGYYTFLIIIVVAIVYPLLSHIFNWGKYCKVCARKASPFVRKCQHCGGEFKEVS
jgi:rRNA maturation endonuclease Nob1